MNYEKELDVIESLRIDLMNKQRDLIYKILSENGGSISINFDEDGKPDRENNPDNVYTNIFSFNDCEFFDTYIHSVSILNDKDKTFKIQGYDIEYGSDFKGEAKSDNYTDILTFISNMIECKRKIEDEII